MKSSGARVNEKCSVERVSVWVYEVNLISIDRSNGICIYVCMHMCVYVRAYVRTRAYVHVYNRFSFLLLYFIDHLQLIHLIYIQ